MDTADPSLPHGDQTPTPETTRAAAADAADSLAERRALARWQSRLLPFMSASIVILGIVFFVISLRSVTSIGSFLQEDSSASVTAKVNALLAQPTTQPLSNGDVMQRGLLLLESDTLTLRYRQASALLMSRIWTRQLAFNTGMVLALIGAVFIIGKLRESSAEVNVSNAAWKAGITSTSPGLILAFMGVVLMAIALIVQPPIDIKDRAIYLMTTQRPGGTTTTGTSTQTDSAPDPTMEDPAAPEKKPKK